MKRTDWSKHIPDWSATCSRIIKENGDGDCNLPGTNCYVEHCPFSSGCWICVTDGTGGELAKKYLNLFAHTIEGEIYE